MEDDEGLSHSERLDRILAGVKKETRGRRRSTKRRSTKRTSKRRSTKRTSKRRSTKRTSKRRSGKRRSVRKTSRKVRFGTDEAPPRPPRPSAKMATPLSNFEQLNNVPGGELERVATRMMGFKQQDMKKIRQEIKDMMKKTEKTAKEYKILGVLFNLMNYYDGHVAERNLFNTTYALGKPPKYMTDSYIDLANNQFEESLKEETSLPRQLKEAENEEITNMLEIIPKTDRDYIKKLKLTPDELQNLIRSVYDYYQKNPHKKIGILASDTGFFDSNTTSDKLIAEKEFEKMNNRKLYKLIDKAPRDPDAHGLFENKPAVPETLAKMVNRLSKGFKTFNPRSAVNLGSTQTPKTSEDQPQLKVGEYPVEEKPYDDGYV